MPSYSNSMGNIKFCPGPDLHISYRNIWLDLSDFFFFLNVRSLHLHCDELEEIQTYPLPFSWETGKMFSGHPRDSNIINWEDPFLKQNASFYFFDQFLEEPVTLLSPISLRKMTKITEYILKPNPSRAKFHTPKHRREYCRKSKLLK